MTNTNTNLSDIQVDVDWTPVIHQLSLATGLPDADLRQGTLPYLQSIASPQDLADALLNLLGSEPHALDLIQVFVQRRFPPAPTPTPAPPAFKQHTTGVSYASVIAPTPPPPPREPTPPPAAPTSSATASTSASSSKKGKQQLSLSQFDKLNRQGKLAPKDRVPCNCHAQSHDLLTNCLTCGRIVCLAEGPGPCFTCSAPVVSSTQQLEALAQRITKGTSASASTLQQEDAALAAAKANQDRLLEYDATSAQRTIVIDTKADYVQYEGAGALWLSQAERDRAAKLDAARRKVALHGSGPKSGDAIKLDLDLARGELERAKEVEDPVLKAMAELDLEEEQDDEGYDFADEYAWNMLENGRVVVKSRSVALEGVTALDQTNKEEQADNVGTGAYFHAGLAVRPVYVETKADDADHDDQLEHQVTAAPKGAKASSRRDRAARQKQAASTDQQHADEAAQVAAVVPGAESLTKKHPAGKRKRNRVKKVAAGSGSAGPQEDDPGCG
ncbi:hypothetical protein BCR44DRAFT_33520 [Catenaria anguillulae PL171]|uniref:TRIP4/RQT4 C2HC5-type zinc finger domain-containing protein n=1 Tax=Catenaria anguillulae PL171 TaxID=765915 RepID=A0A1Y2HJ99_9FUNG|nr:hypothetical protein BCR44DRAFT_33520 [Catenaria anguillulae PL171]